MPLPVDLANRVFALPDPAAFLTFIQEELARAEQADGAGVAYTPRGRERRSHEGFLTTEELAELLRVDPSTVRRWRTTEPMQGPPFIQLSERNVLYAVEDVRQWLADRRIVPGTA